MACSAVVLLVGQAAALLLAAHWVATQSVVVHRQVPPAAEGPVALGFPELGQVTLCRVRRRSCYQSAGPDEAAAV